MSTTTQVLLLFHLEMYFYNYGNYWKWLSEVRKNTPVNHLHCLCLENHTDGENHEGTDVMCSCGSFQGSSRRRSDRSELPFRPRYLQEPLLRRPEAPSRSEVVKQFRVGRRYSGTLKQKKEEWILKHTGRQWREAHVLNQLDECEIKLTDNKSRCNKIMNYNFRVLTGKNGLHLHQLLRWKKPDWWQQGNYQGCNFPFSKNQKFYNCVAAVRIISQEV